MRKALIVLLVFGLLTFALASRVPKHKEEEKDEFDPDKWRYEHPDDFNEYCKHHRKDKRCHDADEEECEKENDKKECRNRKCRERWGNDCDEEEEEDCEHGKGGNGRGKACMKLLKKTCEEYEEIKDKKNKQKEKEDEECPKPPDCGNHHDCKDEKDEECKKKWEKRCHPPKHDEEFTCDDMTEEEALWRIYHTANGKYWRKKNGGHGRHGHHDDEDHWDKCKRRDYKELPPVCGEDCYKDDGKYYDAHSKYSGVKCKQGHVVELDLSDSDLEGKLDPAVGCLKYLKVLHLEKNKLHGKLPSTLRYLKDSLMFMDVSDNKFCTIPKGICKLNRLMFLDISNNEFKRVPKCVKCLATEPGYGVIY